MTLSLGILITHDVNCNKIILEILLKHTEQGLLSPQGAYGTSSLIDGVFISRRVIQSAGAWRSGGGLPL